MTSRQTTSKCPCCGMMTLKTWIQESIVPNKPERTYMQCMNHNCPGSETDTKDVWLAKRRRDCTNEQI